MGATGETSGLGVLNALQRSTEKVPLNLIEVILAQESMQQMPTPVGL
jgi:hypothetical protein